MGNNLEFDSIERLIARHLDGSISDNEQQRLNEWIDSSDENRRLFDMLNNRDAMLDKCTKMRRFDAVPAWSSVEHKFRVRRGRRILYSISSVAAVVAVIVAVFTLTPKSLDIQTLAEIPHDNAVKIHLHSGKVVEVDDNNNSIDMLGAVLEGDAEGMTVTVDKSSENISAITYSVVEVPIGKTFRLTLDDGTKVTLNAGSSLRFPERFASGGLREVNLVGEAFFSVTKDVDRPFIVHTGNEYVRVTGTEFNVASYPDMASQVTTLVSGSVYIGDNTTGMKANLTPGMQSICKDGKVELRSVDTSEYTAWLSDMFAFKDRPLGEIMKSISRWYGCEVQFSNEALSNIRFTGKILRKSTLEQIAKFFSETSDVNVTVDGNNIVIY